MFVRAIICFHKDRFFLLEPLFLSESNFLINYNNFFFDSFLDFFIAIARAEILSLRLFYFR